MGAEMTALIFGSVSSPRWDYLKHRYPEPALVICADGGVRCARSAGYAPDLLVGDWDSGGAPEAGIPSVTLPAEKDLTDLQAAAELALERGFVRLVFTACVGGRLDQTAANLTLLEWVHDRGGEATLLDAGNEARFWDGAALTLERDARYRFLSLIPLDRQIDGVTQRGVKYPLTKATLTRGETLSVSNEIVEEQALLSADSGRLLVVRSQKHTQER